HLAPEALAREAERVGAQRLRAERRALGPVDGLGERLDRLLPEEDARAPLDDRLERAALAKGDHGKATRLGLDRDDAKVFAAREDEQTRRAVELAESLVRDRAEELDRRPGDPPKRAPLGSVARDPQAPPRQRERAN